MNESVIRKAVYHPEGQLFPNTVTGSFIGYHLAYTTSNLRTSRFI